MVGKELARTSADIPIRAKLAQLGVRFLTEHAIARWHGQGASLRNLLNGEETEQALTVEQPLPFLAIGNGLTNEATGRRGHLEAVELRMDDATPRLVLSIGYSEMPGERESGIEDAGRDTLPDEPPIVRASQPSEERVEDTPRIVRYDRSEEPAMAR